MLKVLVAAGSGLLSVLVVANIASEEDVVENNKEVSSCVVETVGPEASNEVDVITPVELGRSELVSEIVMVSDDGITSVATDDGLELWHAPKLLAGRLVIAGAGP